MGTKDNSTTTLVSAAAGLVVVTAITTVTLTQWYERKKAERLLREQYERDQCEKKAARQSAPDNTPSGVLLKGVAIDQLYLWELEDLRRRFPSAKVSNKMRFPKYKVDPKTSSVTSPLLRGKNSSLTKTTQVTEQDYNKLIGDNECIVGQLRGPNSAVCYLRAGPRPVLHFAPSTVSAAIVTCGGLCPGLNNVIREITKTLHNTYGIGGKVFGIQGGYRGFTEVPPIELTPEMVENIHHDGGTYLGSSRGGFDLDKICDFLHSNKVNQLYVIGGDGTHRGAFAIHEGCMARNYNIGVAGIPKTIDNDIAYLDYSFGFQSAVDAACAAIRTAKTEAVCNLPNGIGIVKLMGRSSGYIAAHATMASGDVDLCLVPEVPIVLEGKDGVLPHLMQRVQQQGFAVVVVAEGAGEEILGTSAETDASGNKKLPAIGEFMKKSIVDYFAKNGQTATVKYIDPSYMVRSVPANAADSVYCMQLAQNAVHGTMAGYTGFSVGLCNNRMVYLPIPDLVKTSPRSMNANGRTWERVIALTRQPNTAEKESSRRINSGPILSTRTTA